MHTTPFDTNVPADLPQAANTLASLGAVAANFPEFMIINIAIWSAAITAIIAFSGLFRGPLFGLPVFATLFGAPALWASWQTLKLAAIPQTIEHPSPLSPEPD